MPRQNNKIISAKSHVNDNMASRSSLGIMSIYKFVNCDAHITLIQLMLYYHFDANEFGSNNVKFYWSGGGQMRSMRLEALINKFWVKARLSCLFRSCIMCLIEYWVKYLWKIESNIYGKLCELSWGKWEPKLKEKRDEKWSASFA